MFTTELLFLAKDYRLCINKNVLVTFIVNIFLFTSPDHLLLQEENSLRQRREELMATVENLLVEKEKLLNTIRSTGYAPFTCSCSNSEGDCIHCMSNSNSSSQSESSSSSKNGPESLTTVPDRCDSSTESDDEDDDDDDESSRLYIDTSGNDDALDLSFSKDRHVQMEITDSDSQPCSSQEMTTEQISSYEVIKPVAVFTNKHFNATNNFIKPHNLQDYIKEEQTDMEDSDYVMSSQESTQSLYSSQDSIDGSFLKHGGRNDVSCD